jgi:hypothetical protein
MKIEVVISVWDDNGDFVMRDRIIGDNLEDQIDISLENIKSKMAEREAKKYEIGDDDIPF